MFNVQNTTRLTRERRQVQFILNLYYRSLHNFLCHVETLCGNAVWKHHVETPCGNTVWKQTWKQLVEIACGNSLWKQCGNNVETKGGKKDIYDIKLCLPESNLTLQEQP